MHDDRLTFSFVTILPGWAYKTTREMHAFEQMLCDNIAKMGLQNNT